MSGGELALAYIGGTIFIFIIGIPVMWWIAGLADDHDSAGFGAIFWVSVITWLTLPVCGIGMFDHQMEKIKHQDEVAQVKRRDISVKMPELKHSNLVEKHGKIYFDQELLADTAKNGSLIPHNKLGQTVVTLADYLKQKHVVKTCTNLKVKVDPRGAKATYYSKTGEQAVNVTMKDSKHVKIANKDF